MLPEIFNLMCTRNERGDFCISLFARMSSDLAASGQTTTMTTICNVYGNTGCCLVALDRLYSTSVPGYSFVTTLSRSCPNLVNFNPPACVSYGQTAIALNVNLPLVGLNCAIYHTQDDAFKVAFELAIKKDLAAAGIAVEYISVKSVADVNGVCTLTIVIRASSDAATRDLKPAAATLGTASLTAANAQLQTVPATTTGSVTMQPGTVTEVTLTGQSVGNSGSSVVPSFFLIAASIVMWLA